MAYEKQYEIVDTLISSTEEGTLIWEKSFSENIFEAPLKDYSFRIIEEIDFEENTSYTITVLNKDGGVIERFSDSELTNEQEQYRPRESKSYNEKVRDIYSLIRRKALGIEQVLDDVLEELEASMIPFKK